jgi:hypothetical protein
MQKQANSNIRLSLYKTLIYLIMAHAPRAWELRQTPVSSSNSAYKRRPTASLTTF